VTGAIYTCPMHPQVEQDRPGSCPICGMALEPKTITTSDEEENVELRDTTRRFWIGAALTLPVFVLAMAHVLPNAPTWIGGDLSRWMQFVFSTPVVLWAGWPFFERAWQSVRHRSLNMFTLIAMGVGVAWLYSAIVMLVPDVFPPSFHQHGKIDIYFEAAAIITVLVLLGQVLELRARSRTGAAIRALLGLAPRTARVVRNDQDTTAVIEALKKGKIAYLGLDVYEEEEEIFFEDRSGLIIPDDVFARLLTFPNVIITGHQAFFTREALENIAATTIDNITKFEHGQTLENQLLL
jgi:P-type Cu+ transporter